MNKTFFAIIVMIVWSVATVQATKKEITLDYKECDFIMSYDIRNTLLVSSNIHHSYYLEDASQPAIPFLSVYVYIASNQTYLSHSYEKDERVILSNVLMAPNPELMATNQKPVITSAHEVKFAENVYPLDNIHYTGTQIADGYKILCFRVSPYVYDAGTKTLFFSDSIRLTIDLRESVQSENISFVRNNIENLRLIKNMVVNPNDIEINNSTTVGRTVEETDDVDYVIITSQALKESFQPLVDWKNIKGVRSKIITMEYIDSLYTNENTPQLRIKRCLQDLHINYGLQYALLGGDDTVVPAQYCWGHVVLYNKILDDSIPTDLFYSNFQGAFNWNAINNLQIGAPDDSINMNPEIYVTRAPVRTVSHAISFVNKVLDYEKNPPIENWKDSILTFGFDLTHTGDAAMRGQSIYSSSIQPNWTGGRVRFYNTISDVGVLCSTQTKDFLQGLLGNGYAFIDEISHGSFDSWNDTTIFFPEIYSLSQANTLYNSRPSLISTIACFTNRFDFPNYPCLSEAFIRNPNSGIVTYLGGSREGIAFLNYPGGASELFARKYYEKLFSNQIPNRNYGKVVGLAKAAMIGQSSEWGANRWVMFSLNPIGDPEMPVFVHQPHRFSDVSLQLNGSTLTIKTIPNNFDQITITGKYSNGSEYYVTRTNDIPSTGWQLSSLPSKVTVCFTRAGYVPYVAVIDNGIIYVQGIVYNTDNTIRGNSIIVGSDVNTVIPQGSVSVVSGKMTIIGNNVEIRNNYEVNAGAELEITNN